MKKNYSVRKNLIRSVIIGIVLTGALSIHSYTPDLTSKTDGYSVPYLNHEYIVNTTFGTRSFGMGEAQTARPDDTSAMYYNPAGLSLMGYWEYSLSYKELPNDTHGTSGALSIPMPYGNMGLIGVYHYVRDNYHVEQGENTHPDRNKYAGYVGIAYGAPLYKDQLHAGINIKYAASDLRSIDEEYKTPERSYDPFSHSFYFDLGVIYTYDLSLLRGFFFYFPNVAVGIAARNINFNTTMPDEGNYAKEEGNIGVSFYYDYRFMLNIDMVNRADEDSVMRYGIEVWPVHFLALRGGFQVPAYRVSNYRGYYWGVGLGESVGSSKFALEYSGSRIETPAGPSNAEFYHRFAFVQSFEKIYTYTTKSKKERVIPIAQADRYNTPLQFARFIDPEDIIDEIIDDTSDDDGSAKPLPPDDDKPTPVPDDEKPGPDDDKPAPPIIRKKGIAVYPFKLEFSTAKPYDTSVHNEIRDRILVLVKNDKYLKPMSNVRYKLTPKREQSESYIKYLNRLCLFHRLDVITFASVVIDEQKNMIYLNMMIYRKGDKSITSQYVKKSSMDAEQLSQFKEDAAQNYYQVVAGLLDLKALERESGQIAKKKQAEENEEKKAENDQSDDSNSDGTEEAGM